MYDGMIDALSRAIDRLGKEKQAIAWEGRYFVATRESGNCMRQWYQDVNEHVQYMSHLWVDALGSRLGASLGAHPGV